MLRCSLFLAALPASVTLLPSSLYAAVYGGTGIQGGIDAAKTIVGNNRPIRTIILNVLNEVLKFMALAAAIAVIVAGIYLIASNGNEESKTKAKNIVIYTIVGLVVILLAKLLVQLVINVVQA